MANVRIRSTERHDATYTEYVHRCGEMVNMITSGTVLVGWADISKVRITICPHCLEVLDLDGVQLPQNIKSLGWPE